AGNQIRGNHKNTNYNKNFRDHPCDPRPKFTSPPYAETGGGRSPLTVNQRSATPARLQRLAGAGTAARAFRAGPHLHKQADSPARLSEVSENRQERSTGNTCSRRRSSASGPC